MNLSDRPADEPGAHPSIELATATQDLVPLVEESRATRARMADFRRRYDHRAAGVPLPARSLHEIRKGTRKYLDLQEGLTGVARRAAPFVIGDATHPDAPAVDPVLRPVGVTTTLAASVTLYDNYLAMLPLLGDRHFRRLVNLPDLGYGVGEDEFWDLVMRLNDKHSRHTLEQLVALWPETAPEVEPTSDVGLGRLTEAIESSPSFLLARGAELERRLPTTIRVRRERFLDRIARAGDDAMYAVSEAFGNAIGKVELRKGKLWQREDVLGHLHRVLRPLDLLLEKTPFRLTDLFIPGHFGHVAIWMGKPRQLERLRVWEQEEMQKDRLQACRPLIEEGRSVLEALRPGVELNALRVFANVDDLAILRPTRLTKKDKVASLVRGFQQVGKGYDFNFDVETTGTIVCSELPYHVYPGVDWTTEEQLGRFTISPDHVALEALSGTADFELVAFYHDGLLVPPKDALAKLGELVA